MEKNSDLNVSEVEPKTLRQETHSSSDIKKLKKVSSRLPSEVRGILDPLMKPDFELASANQNSSEELKSTSKLSNFRSNKRNSTRISDLS